ncbi:conserved hypothetical protein [Coccidioides posadasii str. Silveira]|uniref:Uncharacterized protein n=1 Tax=Coccidioides posadasii (strain RMSCC 757 / Silveira) TaxID=443226 RepID=E9DFS5_COCPS|nr:conserved hypothetical protein [Coccidioides posadasii str. Silveira]
MGGFCGLAGQAWEVSLLWICLASTPGGPSPSFHDLAPHSNMATIPIQQQAHEAVCSPGQHSHPIPSSPCFSDYPSARFPSPNDRPTSSRSPARSAAPSISTTSAPRSVPPFSPVSVSAIQPP